MFNYRRFIISSVTFLGGLYFFLEYILPENIGGFTLGLYHEKILLGVQIVGFMAVGLGLINIVRVHGLAIIRGKRGWYNSAGLLAGLFITMFVMSVDMRNNEEMNEKSNRLSRLAPFAEKIDEDFKADSDRERAIKRATLITTELEAFEENSRGILDLLSGDENTIFQASLSNAKKAASAIVLAYEQSLPEEGRDTVAEALATSLKPLVEEYRRALFAEQKKGSIQKSFEVIFQGFYAPLGSAMFSLLAFYIAAAAYRSFRIRSLEALLMMLAALVVMLGQIPHGPLYISESLPDARRWLLLNVSTPAFRAIYFGSLIAGLAMATRMWLSLERSPLESSGEVESEEDS